MVPTLQQEQQKQAQPLSPRADSWPDQHAILIDNLPIGVYRTTPGPHGAFLMANPTMVHMLGFTSVEELVQVSVADVYLNPAQRTEFSDRVLNEGSVSGVELLLRKRDGSPLWTSVTAKAVLQPDTGQVVCFDCTAEDITQRKRAAEIQSLLYGIANAVQVARDKRELFAAVRRELARVMDTHNFFVAVYDPASDTVTLPYFVDEKDEITRFAARKTLTGLVLHRREPVLLTEREIEDLIAAGEIELVGSLCKVWLGVPLEAEGQILGALAVQSYADETAFGREELEILEFISNQVGLASERALAMEGLARHAREMAALYETSLEINAQRGLSSLLKAIVARAATLLNTEVGALYLLTEDEQSLELVVTHNLPQDLTGTMLPLGEGLSGRVAQTGEPLMVNDYRQWTGRAGVFQDFAFHRVLGVPMKVGERVIGVINITDQSQTGSFDEDQVRLVSLFADQAALAVQKARLFSSVEQARRDWEATFDAMQDPVILVDSRGNVLRGNQAFAALLGQEAHEVVGQPFRALFENQQCSAAPCRLQQALQDGRPASCMHIQGDRTFDVQATPVSGNLDDNRGHEVRAIYAMRDVTERKKAEEEVNRRNQELAFLNRIIAAAAGRQSSEALLARVCDEMAAAFGIARAAAVLMDEKGQATVVAASPHTDSPPVGTSTAGQNSRLARLVSDSGELRSIRDVRTETGLDGRIDPLLWSGTVSCLLVPLQVEGRLAGYLELDASEQRRFTSEELALARRVADQVSSALARARLEETQRRLIAVVEQAAEAVVITDTNSVVLYVNPAFERITARSRAEIVGHDAQVLFERGEEGAEHLLAWKRAGSYETLQRRVTSHRVDGSDYTVDLTLTSVRNPSGDVVNLVMTMRDITRELQLEEQFWQAQKLDSLGRLAGGIAHDFNNLLTIIQLSSLFLEKQLRPEDPLWEHVQQIRQTGERATKLTKHLLSFSRREVIDPQVLNLGLIVSDLSRMLRRIIGEDIELCLELAHATWPIKADPAQIEQVIMNLVVNARDAMPNGGTLTIRTANVTIDQAYAARHVDVEAGDHVLLSVSDTGEGMTEEVQGHLFEPFFTTKDRGQGTGLGLATVFGIVKQSGGHIRVDSQVDRGTTFYIYLPRTREKTLPAPLPAPLTPARAESRATVLVVEDDEGVQALTTRALQSYGYQVLQARNGAEAIEISEQWAGHIELLITDMVMPHMSGRELAQRLKEARPDLRALYVSGYADNLYLPLPPNTAFLGKPFGIEDLLQKVQSLLGK